MKEKQIAHQLIWKHFKYKTSARKGRGNEKQFNDMCIMYEELFLALESIDKTIKIQIDEPFEVHILVTRLSPTSRLNKIVLTKHLQEFFIKSEFFIKEKYFGKKLSFDVFEHYDQKKSMNHGVTLQIFVCNKK